jgi:hypothetical protein
VWYKVPCGVQVNFAVLHPQGDAALAMRPLIGSSYAG